MWPHREQRQRAEQRDAFGTGTLHRLSQEQTAGEYDELPMPSRGVRQFQPGEVEEPGAARDRAEEDAGAQVELFHS